MRRDIPSQLCRILVFAAVGAALPSPTASAPQAAAAAVAESRQLRARALDAGYNLDRAEALAAFNAAIAADPSDPAPHRLVAATLWITALFEQGAISVDDYLGQARSKIARQPPRPEVDAAFRAHIARALSLSEARLRDHPGDADAHFQVGAAHGFLASYTATVDGGVLAGFRAARRAYSAHARVLELDATRHDAGLIVGLYRYTVSTLPAPWRLLAGLAGIRGARERGLQLVEQAAANPSDVQTNARFTLIAIYNRLDRFDDALRVIGELQLRYPGNRLLWLEAANTALRAGRPRRARTAIEEGLARLAGDARPRAFGEEARWRYAHGAVLVALNDVDAADRELRAALAAPGHEWVRGRAHKELGKLADLAARRPVAEREYRLALRIARAEHDAAAADELARLLRTPYRLTDAEVSRAQK